MYTALLSHVESAACGATSEIPVSGSGILKVQRPRRHRSERSWLYWNVGRTAWRTVAVGLAFILAIAGTVFFASRAGRRARHIHAENEPIRAWMSVPFIAHTHHVPATVLFQAIGVQPREPHDRRSLRHIARDVNRPVPALIDQLQRAIDATKQPPGGGPPR